MLTEKDCYLRIDYRFKEIAIIVEENYDGVVDEVVWSLDYKQPLWVFRKTKLTFFHILNVLKTDVVVGPEILYDTEKNTADWGENRFYLDDKILVLNRCHCDFRKRVYKQNYKTGELEEL